MKTKKIHIAVAGSTTHSARTAKTLNDHNQFSLNWVFTPKPKKIGRHQKLTANPLHQWAETQSIKTFLFEKNTNELKTKILNTQAKNPIDYLLVVDFGYLIPTWLLQLPGKAVLNLHPSALPSWRGSSPGQYAILYGDQQAAVSLLRLTDELDAGPIIQQIEFSIKKTWTSQDYYDHSFKLANQNLPEWLLDHSQEKIQEKPQPKQSTTPQANKIQKQDAYLNWEILSNLLLAGQDSQKNLKLIKSQLKPTTLLARVLIKNPVQNWSVVIERASRAFQPWPILWTQIPSTKGEKRMQIFSCQVNQDESLQLKEVKIEGQNRSQWNQVKNYFS